MGVDVLHSLVMRSQRDAVVKKSNLLCVVQLNF